MDRATKREGMRLGMEKIAQHILRSAPIPLLENTEQLTPEFYSRLMGKQQVGFPGMPGRRPAAERPTKVLSVSE